MLRPLLVIVLSVTMGNLALAQCPHERADLQRWSTWAGKPQQGENVVIDGPMLLDESPPALSNITIETTGVLVFHPGAEIDLKVTNIFVYGKLEIGSEDCLYTGKLAITLTGTREEHAGEEEPKVILVPAGGTLEIHGRKKLSWTKLDGSLQRPENTGDVLFDHKTSGNDEDNSVAGIVMYVFALNEDGSPRVVHWGKHNVNTEGILLADMIDGIRDGEILMMALQRGISIKKKTEVNFVYDAIEVMVYGKITNTTALRSVQGGDTWAFVYEKGNRSSLIEETNPQGNTSYAAYWSESFNAMFIAMEYGHKRSKHQQENFRVLTRNAVTPLVNVIDDVTTWTPGDKVVFASTDFDWQQAEVKTVVECVDCSNKQFRVDSAVEYTHYGKMLNHAVDTRGEVALLTRNVIIQGEMQDECPVYNGNCDNKYVKNRDTFGSHIKILRNYANVHIEGVEIRNAGQQTDLGRYPVHFHMTFEPSPNATQPYVRENSIHDTFARCTTIHGTHHVHVRDNVCYNHVGHGFFLEDGAEQFNTLDGNIVISTHKGTGTLEPEDEDEPASFWITNPKNTIINNVAAGGVGTGIWFIYPDEPLPPSRAFNVSANKEARSTPILEFYNNVAHSYSNIGVKFGDRLTDERTATGSNFWQPRVNPKDPNSDLQETQIERITGYKNRKFNMWIESGRVDFTKLSTADSLNGIMLTNRGLEGKYSGHLFNSVVMGDTDNVGEFSSPYNRSLPGNKDYHPHSGITTWKGPSVFSNIWFDGFNQSQFYDIGAIAKKRGSPYPFPITTSFTDVQFAFDDGEGLGNRAISGNETDPGWGVKDGEKIAGFTYIEGATKYYVVKGDHLSAAAADCELRENWRLAICNTKYGNLRMGGMRRPDNAIWVRDDLPSAQLKFKMQMGNGPLVVLDGSRSYTVHSFGTIPTEFVIAATGLESGDSVRIGVCVPIGADFNLRTGHPYDIRTKEKFVKVNSLAELDASDANDGQKYYHNESTGMIYYKFINTASFAEDERTDCPNMKCPNIRVYINSGDAADMDCRQRVYGDALNMEKPPLKVRSGVMPANGAKTPPVGWGAGETRPFTDRDSVDGGWGDFSEWSECSQTCDTGQQTRYRRCDNPMPLNGGKSCDGLRYEVRSCLLANC